MCDRTKIIYGWKIDNIKDMEEFYSYYIFDDQYLPKEFTITRSLEDDDQTSEDDEVFYLTLKDVSYGYMLTLGDVIKIYQSADIAGAKKCIFDIRTRFCDTFICDVSDVEEPRFCSILSR